VSIGGRRANRPNAVAPEHGNGGSGRRGVELLLVLGMKRTMQGRKTKGSASGWCVWGRGDWRAAVLGRVLGYRLGRASSRSNG